MFEEVDTPLDGHSGGANCKCPRSLVRMAQTLIVWLPGAVMQYVSRKRESEDLMGRLCR